MDFGRAFTYVFDDPEWIKKILIGGLITLIPLVGSFIVYGYTLEIARRVYFESEERLPAWDDFGGYLMRGFIFWIAMLIWFLPITLLIGCVVVVLIAAGSTGEDAAVALSTLAAFALFGLVLLVVLLWSLTVLPILAGRYAVERRFRAAFQFGEILVDLRRAGPLPLLLLFVLYFVAGFIAQFGFLACFIGVIFTSFFANAVTAHGVGQVYRRARGLEAVSPASQITF